MSSGLFLRPGYAADTSAMPRNPTVVFRKNQANSSPAFSHLAWSREFTKRTGNRMFCNMLRKIVRNSHGTIAFSALAAGSRTYSNRKSLRTYMSRLNGCSGSATVTCLLVVVVLVLVVVLIG